jgi:hypothetical protein
MQPQVQPRQMAPPQQFSDRPFGGQRPLPATRGSIAVPDNVRPNMQPGTVRPGNINPIRPAQVPGQGNIGGADRPNPRPGAFTRDNLHVMNHNNTYVRRNDVRSYNYAPYYWGGYNYYGYYPYAYHPYAPYYWGGGWYPWGFVTGALSGAAIAVALDGGNYYYDNGAWYVDDEGAYTVVQAPVGGGIQSLPSDAQMVTVNGATYFYYGGAFYQQISGSYVVVAPPAGAIVDHLPPGAEVVQLGDRSYYKVGATYYQPVLVNGVDKFEVVQVEAGQ